LGKRFKIYVGDCCFCAEHSGLYSINDQTERETASSGVKSSKSIYSSRIPRLTFHILVPAYAIHDRCEQRTCDTILVTTPDPRRDRQQQDWLQIWGAVKSVELLNSWAGDGEARPEACSRSLHPGCRFQPVAGGVCSMPCFKRQADDIRWTLLWPG
jgi:hypothetical protein